MTRVQTRPSAGACPRLSLGVGLLAAAITCSLWPVPAMGQDVWSTTGRLGQHRMDQTATLLPSGKVLVAGGFAGGGTALSSAELYDPATGSWTMTGSLATAHRLHTATLLPSGKVLVAGGEGGGAFNTSAELYDPATGTWTTTGSLGTVRVAHTATLLPTGKVLVAGGEGGGVVVHSSAELYDPATGTWTTTGSLGTARRSNTATLLSSGNVLVAGGFGSGNVLLSSAELYNAATGTWTTTGSLATARGVHTATLLQGGKVLVAGGSGGVVLSSAELYDPATGTWTTTGSLANLRTLHTATLLPGGKVLVAAGLVGGLVSYSAELYDPATGTWTTTGSLATRRTDHTATLLPSGKVLVAGGLDGGMLSSAELYDAATGTWTTTGSLATPRYDHTATLLPSGKVLVAGGSGGTFLSSAELYDPATGTWTTTGSLAKMRIDHMAMLLPSGQVLVTGGRDSGGSLASAELYDPATGTWATTGSLATPRYDHTATLLPSGRVLVVGGFSGSVYLSSAELYDPATGTWTTSGSLATGRSSHTATLLPSGKVLVAGQADFGGSVLSSAELYDPATGTWTTTGSLATVRRSHTATLLPNGRVLVAAGSDGRWLSSAELYDPATGTWTTTGSLADLRITHTATLLPSGKVLVAGGQGIGGYLSSPELYDPATGTWMTTNMLATARGYHTATLLPSSKVLMAGGLGTGNVFLFATELYDPGPGTIGPASPLLTSVSTPVVYGTPLVVTGTKLGGGSETGSGDTTSSAVNYPLLHVRSVENGHTSWLVPDGRANFSDDPMTLTFTNLPPTLDPGWHYLTAVRAGMRSESKLVEVACSLAITGQPQDQTVAANAPATVAVAAQGARSYQWQYCDTGVCAEADWNDRAGATGTSYTTEPITGPLSGRKYRAIVRGACAPPSGQNCASRPEGCQLSTPATLTVLDTEDPAARIVSPSGGEYWLLSDAGAPAPNTQVVSWTMSDNVRICRVEASLQFSGDGGTSYGDVLNPYNLTPTGGAVLGPGGTCVYPGEATNILEYDVPTSPPSGTAGSLYRIRLTVTDHAGQSTTVTSPNPFYIVSPNADTVRTLVLANVLRMQSVMGISPGQASALSSKLQELASHPRVQGLVVDLAGVTSIESLYADWDADSADPDKANRVLFGCHFPCAPEGNGIHDHVRSLLEAYTGVKYLVIVGDDRIVPMARLTDRASLLKESNYTAGSDLRPNATTVGQALAADKYLSDDPLGVADAISADEVGLRLYVPDLAVGRLVERPEEITTSIATFISQDGVLDLSLLNPSTGHKVLVTGYDFLTDSSKQIRKRWKTAFTCAGLTGDPFQTCLADHDSLAPVDGKLLGANWDLGSVSERADALRTSLGGNGASRYGVMSLNGHATHHKEGVPGTNPFDIQGLGGVDIYGPDACSTASLGGLNLAGGVVYAVGCHGGLPVPGSCATDPDHSLDLAQSFMSRGVVSYVANTGYGWGLKNGIGYGERLVQIFSEELSKGGTVGTGDAVKRTKQRYYLETPRFDPYDEKSLMQWTFFGLPMYAVKTGIAAGGGGLALEESKPFEGASPKASDLAATERYGRVRVNRGLSASPEALEHLAADSAAPRIETPPMLPSFLTQLNLHFDFSAPGVYRKWTAEGDELSASAPCAANSPNGCYYTLNGLVERSTGAGDLPVQPYFIYDSRLSGTSQHGVLWKGGEFEEENGWKAVIGELQSNGGDGSDHGPAPEDMMVEAVAPRLVPGKDPETCRPSDLELNSLIVPAGEALKNQGTDLEYTLERKYRGIDLEVFYFNNTQSSSQNSDREGPQVGAGPYHTLLGTTMNWSVGASDSSGVWRVLVVYSDNTLDGLGRGTWLPVDLTYNSSSGKWEGSRAITGSSRVTYVVQAADNRGNVTWVRYENATLPSTGVPLGVPLIVRQNLVSEKRAHDFNGDGRTDLLWRHKTSGDAYLWLMDGETSISQHFLGLVGTPWKVMGTGDHDGDGKADILWRHPDGYIYLWLMDGQNLLGQGLVGDLIADADWEIVGSGDHTGDRKADILWRHKLSGDIVLWEMNGLGTPVQQYVGNIDANWKVVGTGDANGDGKADILWRQDPNGWLYVWLMDGATQLSQHYLDTVSDLDWEVTGHADFDGDLKADILWRHKTTGDVWLWGMDGGAISSRSYVGTGAATEWEIVGSGDQSGDGKADVLWRHKTRGDLYLWVMEGPVIISQGFAGSVGTDWEIVGMKQ